MNNESSAAALSFGDYFAIVGRRKLQFFLPLTIVIALSTALALLLPPTFRSDATILVERQEVPENIVGTTVTGFVQERIEAITQRVLTRDNLLATAAAAGINHEEMSDRELSSLVSGLKDSIIVEMVDVEATDPGNARATTLTIAFIVAAEASTAGKAQKMTRYLSELYLQENKRLRVEQATEVNRFLESQADILADKIDRFESELAEFKTTQIGQLPGQQEMNQTLLERTEARIDTTEDSIRTLQNQRRALQAELSTVDKYVARNAVAEDATSTRERLAIARQDLNEARQKYSDLHPNVRRLRAQIRSLEEELKSQGAGVRSAITDDATNPEYIRIRSQLAAVETDLTAERKKLNELELQSAEYSERLMSAPLVERDYTSLLREYDTAKKAFEEIKAKQLSAKLASNLEEDEKGQKFTLLEPASLPALPVRPNRIAIFSLGIFIGGLLAVGFVIMAEMGDKTVRGVRELSRLYGAPPIGVIPKNEFGNG